MGACNHHQGSWFKECLCQGLPRGPIWRGHIEQLRPRYRVEEDVDPEQASDSMMPLEDLGLGETPKERGDSSRVEEPESRADLEREKAQPDIGGHSSMKRNPKQPTGSEYGPHNPRKSK